MPHRTVILPPPADPADWVRARMLDNLMGSAPMAIAATFLTVPILYAVLMEYTWLPGLQLWALVATLVCVARYAVVHQYRAQQRDAAMPREMLDALYLRSRWLWPASAVVWGASLFLCLNRAGPSEEFVCLIVLVAMAASAVGSLAGDPRAFRQYMACLTLTVGAAIVNALVRDEVPYNQMRNVSLLLLSLLFAVLTVLAGNRLQRLMRSSLELQFRNDELIESLTRQTRAAMEAVDTRNRFLANAAHDLRQPVHALSLYADWLNAEPELVSTITPKIVESTRAVNRLFDALFDLDRLDSGKVRAEIDDVDLWRLLQDLDLQYRPLAEAKGLKLRVRPFAGVVRSDAILLQRILGNLLANAVKYTPTGGILLAVRRRSGRLLLEVWDTGVGIAEHHRHNIYREFYKVPQHAGTEDGFGLGLSIVTRLAGILGHRLSHNSVPGRGSVFRLEVALPAPAGQAGQPPSSP